MLSNFKESVKKHEFDIVLTIGILLIALVSFGAGLLIDFSEDSQSIIIQNSTSNTIDPNDLGTGQAASVHQSLPKTEEQGRFVGSVNSNKYHWPDCPWAEKIGEQNKIWFDSEEEARNAGYARCRNFEKYIKDE